ncbi:redox-regulated ATPase YchF [Candidatus Pacearchaeota archaeon]|nr:redox-regulated ATPase YchF [Candidatus Pacearchaeota archaeon]
MLIGLVGKPSVGKSTFFKAATLAEVDIASYPFTTIKANHGVGYVKVECIDKEFKVQCQPKHGFCINHQRFVPVDIMDVAGLVPGASEGKGLGNQFLDDLREADVFIHIVDSTGTTNAEGKPLDEGETYDPCNDIRFLEEELNKWYFNILVKAWKSFAKKAEAEDVNIAEAVAKQFSGLKVNEDQIKNVIRRVDLPERPSQWSQEQLMEFASELRSESKPMIIAANKCDHPNAKENIKRMQDTFPELMIYPCSANSELALRNAAKNDLIEYVPGEDNFKILKEDELSDKQKKALEKIKKEVLDVYNGTGVQEILNLAVFDLLKYIAVFPAGAKKLADSEGNILPDCFLLPPGSTALDFAYFLHSDFGDNFIKAIDARTKQAKGKDYKLKHRDALEIATN